MAKILFGGPGEEYHGRISHIHQNLVLTLESENHEVDYVNEGDDMIAGLNICNMPEYLFEHLEDNLKPRPYSLIIYETSLFYPCDKIEDIQERTAKRIDLFKTHVIDYLNWSKAPKIILADEQVAKEIKQSVKEAGFFQFDMPYSLEEVSKKISELV